jgi:hypothetical protein
MAIMPRIRPVTRILALVIGVVATGGAATALRDRDWLSMFILADLAALCAYAGIRSRDPVAPSTD